jgi:2-oxo-4-hydroxy-4-carboxy--5-ureidoimidazoline (OHCU) decarboxylase
VERLSPAEQIDIVNAHPRIGENPETVRLASAQSYAEQGYAAEAALPADTVRDVYATLAELNRQYEDRFGFGFVVFVNHRPKSEIVEVLRERLHNTREAELRTALRDMVLIARDRWSGLSPDSNAAAARVACEGMHPQGDDAARLAVLEELRHSALEIYGEERCAETDLQTALGLAATAIWRVSQESLDQLGDDPLPTDA